MRDILGLLTALVLALGVSATLGITSASTRGSVRHATRDTAKEVGTFTLLLLIAADNSAGLNQALGFWRDATLELSIWTKAVFGTLCGQILGARDGDIVLSVLVFFFAAANINAVCFRFAFGPWISDIFSIFAAALELATVECRRRVGTRRI
jgi:uncharacterized integral membrane protein